MDAHTLKSHAESRKLHQALYPVSRMVQKNPYKCNWNLLNGEEKLQLLLATAYNSFFLL